MKNILRDIETGLFALAFAGAVLAAPAGYHLKKIANNYYIESPAKRYYDGKVLKMSKEQIDERINLGENIIQSSLVVSALSFAGGIALNQKRKNMEKGK